MPRNGISSLLIVSILALSCTLALPAYAAVTSTLANGNTLYVDAEQLLALPSKNGAEALIIDTLTVTNNTGHRASVEETLPSGIASSELVTTSSGWRLAGQAVINDDMAPGTAKVIIEMVVNLAQQAADLTFTSPLPIRSMIVIIPEGALVASAEGGFAPSSQVLSVKGVAFRRLTRPELMSNTPWTLALTELPTANIAQASALPGVPVLDSDSTAAADWEAISNLLIAVLILAVSVFAVGNPGPRSGGTPKYGIFSCIESTDSLSRRKNEIMQQWVAVERLYRKGGMTREDYERAVTKVRDLAIDIHLQLES